MSCYRGMLRIPWTVKMNDDDDVLKEVRTQRNRTQKKLNTRKRQIILSPRKGRFRTHSNSR
uniref:Uncharacterized protein n=1 Tax=Arion vulgaris TaxID=1028688 RepID=A0A0B7AC10_9EUPU